MVTETKKNEIKTEVHKLLTKFGKTLDGLPVTKTTFENTGSGTRQEGSKPVVGPDFRERMFANAPKKDKDCIVAEKGAWV